MPLYNITLYRLQRLDTPEGVVQRITAAHLGMQRFFPGTDP